MVIHTEETYPVQIHYTIHETMHPRRKKEILLRSLGQQIILIKFKILFLLTSKAYRILQDGTQLSL